MGNKKIYAFWHYLILFILLFCSGVYLAFAIFKESDLHFVLSISALINCLVFISLKLQCINFDFENKKAKYFTLGVMTPKKLALDEWNYNLYLLDVEKIEIVN